MRLRCSSPAVHHVQYDLDSYSHNFDDGLLSRDDPDNVSRSFSARFALVPNSSSSKLFLFDKIKNNGDQS
ncbi:Late embryogenesis abundant protein [Senna tora]|uniref:Late embryogenesis abundant protein n=1 Tax=Senna tora TaxID=362788 RepID=A0A834XDF4_9FABA|nr:Late embryogenesis abundant protein [Senna tora]